MSGPLRVALAQLNGTIGALAANADAIVRAADEAQRRGADLAVFPELALTAYGPRDLMDRPGFMEDVEAAIGALAARLPTELTCLVGAPVRARATTGRGLVNAALVIRGGRVEEVIGKRLLPTYDVFDEDRWFDAGTRPGLVTVRGVRVGVTICEDAWNDVALMRGRRYAVDPVADVVAAGAEVIVNLSGSPFTLEKREGRGAMLAEIARTHRRPVVMVNQVGGHDELVFDGQSAIYGPNGEPWARAPAFEEALLVCDLAPGGAVADVPGEEAAILAALTLGVRDYAARCGLGRALVGLSGGIDSALVAAVAVRALGKDRVHGVAMPSRYSSEHSVTDARVLAQNLGVSFSIVPIEPLFAPYLEVLPPALAALGDAPAEGDVTFENVQARLRMSILMALANRSNALLLNTGNKSEVACGYCTLYGDMAGGLAVLADVYKTAVYRVSREVNRQAGFDLIPTSTLEKPPSAELRPNQTDQDSLPPYDVLDAILVGLVEGQKRPRALVEEGHDPAVVEKVARLVRLAEHKRRQMPPGLIVTQKAFGPGRRVPIAQRYGL